MVAKEDLFEVLLVKELGYRGYPLALPGGRVVERRVGPRAHQPPDIGFTGICRGGRP